MAGTAHAESFSDAIGTPLPRLFDFRENAFRLLPAESAKIQCAKDNSKYLP